MEPDEDLLRRLVVAFSALGARWFLSMACAVTIGCSGVPSRLDGEKAQQAMRDLRSAEETFLQRNGRYGDWKELIDAGLLDRSMAGGTAFGYRFELGAQGKTYQSVAAPQERNDAQAYVGWSFYLDESRVIRGTPYGKDNGYVRADKTSQPIRTQ